MSLVKTLTEGVAYIELDCVISIFLSLFCLLLFISMYLPVYILVNKAVYIVARRACMRASDAANESGQ